MLTLLSTAPLTGTGTLTIGTAVSTNSLTLNSGSSLSGFNGLVAGVLTISGATYNFGSYTTFDVNGAFTLSSAAVFTAPTGTATFASTFTLNAGTTFNANGGTVTFDGSAAATLSCNNVIFNLVIFAHTTAAKTVSIDCNLPLGNNPTVGADANADITLNGTLSGTGTMTIGTASTGNVLILNSTSSLSGFSGLAAGILIVSGATANFGSYTTFSVASTYTQTGGTITVPSGADFNSVFTLSSSGVFNAPSGVMTVASNFTLNSGTTFNHNNGTVTFDGAGATLICNNTVFYLVTFNKTNTKTVSSDCSLPLGANPTLTGTGSLLLNGTLSGSGTLTSTGFLSLNSTALLSGFSGFVMSSGLIITDATVDFSGYSTFTIAGSYGQTGGTISVPDGADFNGIFILSSGGVFNAPSGTASFANNFTLNSGTTFNANGGTVTFDGGGAILSCNNAVFNLVTINKSIMTSANTFSINNGCNLPLGDSPTVAIGSGTLRLLGTLSGSGTLTLTTAGFFKLVSGYTISGFTGLVGNNLIVDNDVTADFGSYSTFDLSDNFSQQLNSIFIAPSGLMNVGGNFDHVDGTFTHNSGTVVLDGTNQTLTGATTFYNLTKQTAGTLTFPASTTTTILGTLTLKGADSSNLLLLRSNVPGTQWNIDPQGTRVVNYVNVQDSNNTSGTVVIACNSIDSGNNTGWLFNTSACSAPSFAQSTTQAPSCSAPSPAATPINLYSAIARGSGSVLLAFSDASDPYDHYTLEYGTASGVYTFGADNIGGRGTREYLVQSLSPSTTYYFRVRAGNGCATGQWSNEISIKTLSFFAVNNLGFASSTLLPVGDEEGGGNGDLAGRGSASNNQNGSCSSYTVKSGDSLSSIAKSELGEGNRYKELIELNKNEYPSLKPQLI